MSSELSILSGMNVTTLVTLSTLVLVIATFILKFLNNTNETVKEDRESTKIIKEFEKIRSQFDILDNAVKKNKEEHLNFTSADKEQILNNIENKLRQESEEKYVGNLELKIKKNAFEEIFNDQIERSIDRLRNEKNSSFLRGNFNLMIGVMISIIGGYIAYTFIQKLPTAATTIELFSYTLPRLSFFMLIILLAFFFLNLYRKSMDDIKYYQNEITNLEAKYLSLQIAKSMNNHKLISSILEQLVKTERNFVLEKDQSTIELEKERISSNNANNTLQAVMEIFKNQK